MSKRRQQRLSDLIKEELSLVLFQRMNDPRLSLCNLTNVTLTPDLRHAKVKVSVIGDQRHKEECLSALNAASGFFRRELGKLDLRYTPTVQFYIDSGPEYLQHIEELLKTTRKDDEES